MREFKTSCCGVVDLDDESTYEHLIGTFGELKNLMYAKIGYYYCYVEFYYKDIFKTENKQKNRVKKLIKNFTENIHENNNNILWIKEQIFIFDDEIENMC